MEQPVLVPPPWHSEGTGGPLTVLIVAGEEKVALRSDGRLATFSSYADAQRASPRLRALLQEYGGRLARLVGRWSD
jgi:hypothetical protein